MVQIKKSSLKKYHKPSLSQKVVQPKSRAQTLWYFHLQHFFFAFLPVKAFKEINRKLSSRAYGYGSYGCMWVSLCVCVCVGECVSLVCMYVCIGVLGLSSSFVVSQLNLPPTTRQVITISSPSCLGPNWVPFSWRPQRSMMIGCSGSTKDKQDGGEKQHRWMGF